MPFGRYKGWMYQEVPEGYINWAVKEVQGNPNAHEDLVRFATWGAQELERKSTASGTDTKKKDMGRDPEALALVPPPPIRSDKGPSSSSDTSWSKVSNRSGYPLQRKADDMGLDTDIADEQELLEDQAERIRALENQLASLKKQTKGHVIKKTEGK